MANNRRGHNLDSKQAAIIGAIGGEVTFTRYGSDYMRMLAFRAIEKHGLERMKVIGRKGGEAYNMRYVAGGLAGSIHPKDQPKRDPDDELPY